jgi:peptide chain release factor subunit 1
LALFAGNNTINVVNPPQPINQFIYKCDKRFYLDILFSLYENKEENGVILISGHCCYFYMISHTINLLHQFDVSLQSRQKKGGQSAVRIARLAEEKRHLYVKKVVELMNQFYVDKVKSLLIAGPAELKTTIFNCDLIDYRLKPLLLKPVTIDAITNESIYALSSIFNTNKLSIEDQLCHDIITSLQNETKYIYGHDMIKTYLECQNCQCLYIHESVQHHFKNVHIVVIKTSNHDGQLFCQYGGIILLPYYIMNDIID